MAAEKGHTNVVELLLRAGANTELQFEVHFSVFLLFVSLLCQPIFASLVIHYFDPRDSSIEDPFFRGHCQRNTGTCR